MSKEIIRDTRAIDNENELNHLFRSLHLNLDINSVDENGRTIVHILIDEINKVRNNDIYKSLADDICKKSNINIAEDKHGVDYSVTPVGYVEKIRKMLIEILEVDLKRCIENKYYQSILYKSDNNQMLNPLELAAICYNDIETTKILLNHSTKCKSYYKYTEHEYKHHLFSKLPDIKSTYIEIVELFIENYELVPLSLKDIIKIRNLKSSDKAEHTKYLKLINSYIESNFYKTQGNARSKENLESKYLSQIISENLDISYKDLRFFSSNALKKAVSETNDEYKRSTYNIIYEFISNNESPSSNLIKSVEENQKNVFFDLMKSQKIANYYNKQIISLLNKAAEENNISILDKLEELESWNYFKSFIEFLENNNDKNIDQNLEVLLSKNETWFYNMIGNEFKEELLKVKREEIYVIDVKKLKELAVNKDKWTRILEIIRDLNINISDLDKLAPGLIMLLKDKDTKSIENKLGSESFIAGYRHEIIKKLNSVVKKDIDINDIRKARAENLNYIPKNIDIEKLRRLAENDSNWQAAKDLIHDIESNNLNSIKKFVSGNIIWLNYQNEKGNTVLMSAIDERKIDILDELLEQPIDIEIKNRDQETALMIAVRNGDIKAVRKLIDAGADINTVNNKKQTALDVAIEKSYKDVADELCNAYIKYRSINNRNEDGDTPLMVAMKSENVGSVKRLLKINNIEKIDFNAKNSINSEDYLSMAIRLGNEEIFDILTEQDIYVAQSMIYQAINDKRPHMASKLIDILASRKIKLEPNYDRYRGTLLIKSLQQGYLDVAEKTINNSSSRDMLTQGVYFETQGHTGYYDDVWDGTEEEYTTPLIIAEERGFNNIFNLLYNKINPAPIKFDINTYKELIENPLYIAESVKSGDLNKAIKLIAFTNFYIEIRDKDDICALNLIDNALNQCMLENNNEKLNFLIDNAKYVINQSIINKAIKLHRPDIAFKLIDIFINLDAKIEADYDNDFYTSLARAIKEGYIDVAKKLIYNISSEEILTKESITHNYCIMNDYDSKHIKISRTPLSLAKENQLNDISKLLIEKINPEIGIFDKEYLAEFIKYGDQEIVKELINLSNIKLEDNDSKFITFANALNEAIIKGDKEIIISLIEIINKIKMPDNSNYNFLGTAIEKGNIEIIDILVTLLSIEQLIYHTNNYNFRIFAGLLRFETDLTDEYMDVVGKLFEKAYADPVKTCEEFIVSKIGNNKNIGFIESAIKMTSKLFPQEKYNLNSQYFGNPLIIHAVKKNLVDSVTGLIDRGVDLNSVGEHRCTALMYAIKNFGDCREGSEIILQKLIEHGAKIDKRSKEILKQAKGGKILLNQRKKVTEKFSKELKSTFKKYMKVSEDKKAELLAEKFDKVLGEQEDKHTKIDEIKVLFDKQKLDNAQNSEGIFKSLFNKNQKSVSKSIKKEVKKILGHSYGKYVSTRIEDERKPSKGR